MGNYSTALTDVEDFKSIVSTLENQRILAEHNRLENAISIIHAVEEQAGREMNEVNKEPDLMALKFLYSNTDTPENATEPVSNCTPAPVPAASSSGPTSVTPLPAYLSELLTKPRPALQGPATMEQMRAELRELRDELDTLKTQHKREIKLLMNELDEEKKMRLSLQIDVERLKKHMSK